MTYQPKSYKKFVATAATATLVASALVPVASAASFTDVSSNYKVAVDYLVAKNIADGTSETTFGTTASIKRGDAAVMIANALNLNTATAPDAGFTDLNSRVAGAVNALAAEGIIGGTSATTFSPDANITRQEMAKVITNAYNLDSVGTTNTFKDVNSNWDAFVNALVKHEVTLGLTTELFGATEDVTRGQFALFVHRSETLAPATPEVVSVSAIDVNKVEVTFNKAVDTSKAVVKLTKGLANYNVTTEWNEAKDTVVITSVLSKLSPSEYTVVVEGLTEKALSTNVKFEAETANKVEVTTSTVDVAGTATVYFNVLNQYGTKFTTADPTKLTVNTTESIADVSFSAVTAGAASDARGNLKGDFTITNASNKLKAGDTFKVTAVYEGLTTSTNVTFVDPIDLATLSFGQVAPLKDKTRITIGDDDLVVPYTAVDQYGAAYELTSTGGITWVSSDSDIVNVSSLAIVDKKLTVDAGTKAGTAIITAILADGTTAQFSVTVEAEAYANTVSISAPTTLVADGEKASLDIVVQDQFGQVIPNKDVAGLSFSNSFAINPKTGKLEGTVTKNAAFKVTATRTSDNKELAAVTFAVEDTAVANTISAINFETLLEVGASKELTLGDVVVKDQYGRTFEPTSVEVTEVDATNDNLSVTTNTLEALVAGSKVFKVAVNGSASAVKNITLTAVASTDITSYELSPIGTIYNNAAYAATPELIGKTTDGKSVVLVAGKIASLTSSNVNVAVINGLTVEGALAANAADATSTIKAWDANGVLLGSSVVTVTNTAPALTEIEAADLTVDATTTLGDVFISEDQYGASFDEAGTWYFTDSLNAVSSSTSSTATLSDDNDAFDLVAGDYSVKFVSTNGEVVATTTITVVAP